jgi:hypothetical protein
LGSQNGVTATGEIQQPQPIPPALPGVPAAVWQDVMATRPVLPNNHPMPPSNWNGALGVLGRDPGILERFHVPQDISEPATVKVRP